MKTKTKELIYIPPPPVPAEFWTEFNKIVPVCPGDSTQRMLRYVWGCDRMELRKNCNRRRYVDFEGKCVGYPRWVLEGWQSSDVYSRADWKSKEQLLGDFPNNGVWDFIEYHEDSEQNYLPLDESALSRVRSWAFWRSKGHARSVDELMLQMEMRDAMEEEARKIAAEKVLQDFGEEYIKAEENVTNPAFSLPSGMKTTDSGLIVPNN